MERVLLTTKSHSRHPHPHPMHTQKRTSLSILTLRGPFRTAPGPGSQNLGALDVGEKDMYSETGTQVTALSRSAAMMKVPFEQRVDQRVVPGSVSSTMLLRVVDMSTATTNTYAHYAEVPTVLESVTHLAPANPINPFADTPLLDPLPFHDFEEAFIPRSPAPDASDEDIEVFNRIVTPYVASAFEKDLQRFNLTDRFPLLVRYLTKGFPLGQMPPIRKTVIIPNHSSATKHKDLVNKFIAEEDEAGRMSGPFTQERLERILGGPFVSVSFLVVEASQGPGKPSKYRICNHASKGGFDEDGVWLDSINSFVEKDKFPTTFDTANQVANWVSFISFFFAV